MRPGRSTLAALWAIPFHSLPASAFLPVTNHGLQPSLKSRHQRAPFGAREGVRWASSLSEDSDVDSEATEESSATEDSSKVADIQKAATSLLEACEGLDRGAAADAAAAATVSRCVKALEVVAPCTLVDEALVHEALLGRWRLLYSSTFAREEPAASSAAPPPFGALSGLLIPGGGGPVYSQGFGGAPLGVTNVFQEITAPSPPEQPYPMLANQVELTLPPPLPFLPPVKLRLSLKHKLSTDGEAVRIDLVETTARLAGVKGKGSIPAPRALLGALQDALEATSSSLSSEASTSSGSSSNKPEAIAMRTLVATLPLSVRSALAESVSRATGANGDVLEPLSNTLEGTPLGAPIKEAQRFQTRASTFVVTALADVPTSSSSSSATTPPAGGKVRVARSALGEMRVFVKT